MKKVFVILSIVLLLFISIVPCFAERPGYYNQLNSFLPAYSFGDIDISTSSDSLFVSVSGTCTVLPSYGQLKLGKDIAYHRDGTRYFFIFPSVEGVEFGLAGYSSHSSSFTFQQFAGTDWSNSIYFQCELGVEYHFENWFCNVVNVTALYGAGNEPTLSEFLEDYPLFQTQAFPVTDQSAYTGNFFDPFLNFYSSVSHNFDFLPGLFSNQYLGVTIFVSSILFILLMIFIIAMVIRRCRNV